MEAFFLFDDDSCSCNHRNSLPKHKYAYLAFAREETERHRKRERKANLEGQTADGAVMEKFAIFQIETIFIVL